MADETEEAEGLLAPGEVDEVMRELLGPIVRSIEFHRAVEELTTWWPFPLDAMLRWAETLGAPCVIPRDEVVDYINRSISGVVAVTAPDGGVEYVARSCPEEFGRKQLVALCDSIDGNWRDLSLFARRAGYPDDAPSEMWGLLQRSLEMAGFELDRLHGTLCARRVKRPNKE